MYVALVQTIAIMFKNRNVFNLESRSSLLDIVLMML